MPLIFLAESCVPLLPELYALLPSEEVVAVLSLLINIVAALPLCDATRLFLTLAETARLPVTGSGKGGGSMRPSDPSVVVSEIGDSGDEAEE